MNVVDEAGHRAQVGAPLDQLEARLLASLAADEAARAEALDALLGALLAEFEGLSPRSTDGVIILREDLGAARYFAVGIVFMIEDQSRHPVAIELTRASAAGGVESGRVRLGVAPAARGWQQRIGRVENALLASPREAAEDLAWAIVFDRDAAGWRRA